MTPVTPFTVPLAGLARYLLVGLGRSARSNEMIPTSPNEPEWKPWFAFSVPNSWVLS